MDNNVLVITGMHRSGTSLITQWLYKCGLHVGDSFLGAGIGNNDGHYEDIDFYNYHQQVLTEHELPSDGLAPASPQALTTAQRTSLKALLHRKAAGNAQWGWKDPRTCLFLPFYRETLPNARYLVILRDYKTVVSSLVQRLYTLHAWKYEQSDLITKLIWRYFKKPYRRKKLLKQYCDEHLAVWITYNEAILKHLQQLPATDFIVVEHTKLKTSNKEIFKHLSGNWHFDLQYHDFDTLYKEKLVSDPLDIVHYVKDPALLQKAAEIQYRLLALAI